MVPTCCLANTVPAQNDMNLSTPDILDYVVNVKEDHAPPQIVMLLLTDTRL